MRVFFGQSLRKKKWLKSMERYYFMTLVKKGYVCIVVQQYYNANKMHAPSTKKLLLPAWNNCFV